MSSLGRATALMSLGTVLSRVTGLLRVFAIAAALGIAEPGSIADAYNLANTAPNILYELVLGGILTSVFVPVFVELVEKEGRERAWEVGSSLINLSLIVLLALAALGILAAPLIAKLYTLNVEGPRLEAQREVLTFLLRLFIPQIIFYGLAALTAGLLNAHKRFGPPMFTPILNNLTVIAVFLLFRAVYDQVTLGTVTTPQLLLIGVGTSAGVAIMALTQLPFLRGLGSYSLKTSYRHPSVRTHARLSIFVIGYVMANQLGYLIVQVLAAGQQGGYAAYVYAFTFFMLPHGLFAVSVITALLPGMSERAVRRDWGAFSSRLGAGVRMTVFLVLPAAVGYLILAEPIVRLLIQHGNATARSTELVSGVLRFFVLGLLPFSLFQLFLRAFYALQDSKTPFVVNCGAVALNVAVNFPLFHLLGVEGLAAGHALSYVFGTTLLARFLGRRIGGLGMADTTRAASRMVVAAAGMGVAVWTIVRLLAGALGAGLTAQVVEVAVPVVAGAAVYLAIAAALKVEEMSAVKDLLARRGA